jgi:hypothetical protein
VLAYSHIAHDCRVEEHVIFSNNTTLAGHVEVEEYAIIGGLTAVHQFCRIGQHSICGGCTKIVQDVPPYMIADGSPARKRTAGRDREGICAKPKALWQPTGDSGVAGSWAAGGKEPSGSLDAATRAGGAQETGISTQDDFWQRSRTQSDRRA